MKMKRSVEWQAYGVGQVKRIVYVAYTIRRRADAMRKATGKSRGECDLC